MPNLTCQVNHKPIQPGAQFNITIFPGIGISFTKIRQSFLCNMNSYTGNRDCPRQRYWDILPYFSKKSHCYFEMTNFYHWNLIRICAILELVWNSPIVLQVQAYPCGNSGKTAPGISLCVRPASERRRYNVTTAGHTPRLIPAAPVSFNSF